MRRSALGLDSGIMVEPLGCFIQKLDGIFLFPRSPRTRASSSPISLAFLTWPRNRVATLWLSPLSFKILHEPSVGLRGMGYFGSGSHRPCCFTMLAQLFEHSSSSHLTLSLWRGLAWREVACQAPLLAVHLYEMIKEFATHPMIPGQATQSPTVELHGFFLLALALDFPQRFYPSQIHVFYGL